MSETKLNVRAIIYTLDWGAKCVFFVTPLTEPGHPQLPGGPVSERGLVETIVSQFTEQTGAELEEDRLKVFAVTDSPRPTEQPVTIVYQAHLPSDIVRDAGLFRDGSKITSSGFYELSKLDPKQFDAATWDLIKPMLKEGTALLPSRAQMGLD